MLPSRVCSFFNPHLAIHLSATTRTISSSHSSSRVWLLLLLLLAFANFRRRHLAPIRRVVTPACMSSLWSQEWVRDHTCRIIHELHIARPDIMSSLIHCPYKCSLRAAGLAAGIFTAKCLTVGTFQIRLAVEIVHVWSLAIFGTFQIYFAGKFLIWHWPLKRPIVYTASDFKWCFWPKLFPVFQFYFLFKIRLRWRNCLFTPLGFSRTFSCHVAHSQSKMICKFASDSSFTADLYFDFSCYLPVVYCSG